MMKQMTTDRWREMEHLRTRELLFSVIPEVTDNNDNLTHQRDPEGHRRERTVLEPISGVPQSEVWEDLLSRNGWSCDDDDNRAQHLGDGESRANVETREGLEKDQAQTDTLNGIKDSQPEPQGNADPGSSTSRPWNV